MKEARWGVVFSSTIVLVMVGFVFFADFVGLLRENPYPVPPAAEEPFTLKSIGKPVCIVWEDAAGYPDTWVSAKEILVLIEPPSIISCGWVIMYDEDRVWMGSDRNDQGGVAYYAGISSIPKGWIWQVSID